MDRDRQNDNFTDDERFLKTARTVLDKAGKSLNYRQAALLLATTPEDVYARITKKEIVAVAYEGAAVIPSIQFEKTQNGHDVVPGVSQLLKDFTQAMAGDWSALQFLVEPDKTLKEKAPIDVLKQGGADALRAVRHATFEYLA